MEPQFATINGAGCRFAVSGSTGAAVVFIHELGGSLDSWGELVSILGNRARCISYDLRGSGMSQKVRGALDLDVLADDLHCLLQHLKISGGAVVVGAAAGGAVAVRFATRHPQHVKRLVLLSPALTVPEERREAARTIASDIETNGVEAIADSTLPKAFPETLWTSEAAKSRTLARWYGADPEGYAALYRSIIDGGVTGDLDSLYAEVLVVAGSEDPFNPPDSLKQRVKPIRNLTFRTVKAGHFMAVQSPEQVADVLETVLQDRAGE